MPQSNRRSLVAALIGSAIADRIPAWAQAVAGEYNLYAGSTHAHTSYTWSHGEQFQRSNCVGILTYGPLPGSNRFGWISGERLKEEGCASIMVINGSQVPGPAMKVKPDWEKYQGPPAEHYRIAKSLGYGFYTVSDHSQEAVFQPTGPENETWRQLKRQAQVSSDPNFVALAGFEFSENDGPGGKGHINVINSAGMLNALAPGVDLPAFYRWLITAQPNGEGPVVATFNHPGPEQYRNWADRDPQVTEVITMLEVINSNNKIHYAGFVNALDHGWKVSPVCGNDNHGLSAIPKQASRTFVLAKSQTKVAILDAMKNRRTYASLDPGLDCRYTVNGSMMGSTLSSATQYRFDIAAKYTGANPKANVSKIDIVTDGGKVILEHVIQPGSPARWAPVVDSKGSRYFFVRIWTSTGGDALDADPSKPVAWLAPVWTSHG